MYTYTHYIHCTYIEDINTCTFIQSYKPINLYTHNAAEGTPGLDTHKCVPAGATHEDVQNPVYKRPKPSLSQGGLGFTNFTSKLRHFKEPYNLDWKGDKGSIWASARPAPTFPGYQGHYPPPPTTPMLG